MIGVFARCPRKYLAEEQGMSDNVSKVRVGEMEYKLSVR